MKRRSVSLPVFSIPLRTQLRDVIGVVNRSLMSSEVRSLQRLSSLELYLMDALEDEQPRRAVVQRLAAFVETTVTLFSSDGAVIEATGDAPTDSIWEEITARPAALVNFRHTGWETIATPLGAGRGDVSWLALSSSGPRPMPRVARTAARATVPVLTALARLDDLADAQDRAVRGAVLDALLDSGSDADHATLAARAAVLGADFSSPASVVLVAAGSPSSSSNTIRPQLEQALRNHSPRYLASTRNGSLVLLVQAELGSIRAALDEALGGEPEYVAGVGRPATDVRSVPQSLQDAELALQHASNARSATIVSFEDFDIATLVASEISSERLNTKIDELLGMLTPNPGVYEALVAYFEHDLDIMKTAEAMHLHHNSLRYRLGRAENYLGRSLKDPATITSLYIALTARRPD